MDSKSGCGAGAIGAAVGEMAAEAYGRRNDTTQFASMMGGIAAALGGADAQEANVASQAGANAAANNYLNHDDAKTLSQLVDACKTQCTPSQREQLADLIAQDSTTTAALNGCAGSQSTACQAIRSDYAAAAAAAAAASFLPTDGDIWTWARTQAGASNGRYSAAEIYDAYRTNFIAGAVPNMSVGDLTQAAEWMRGRIVGDGTAANPGEGPLSPIAMGWAVGNNASAQGALSAGLLAMAGTRYGSQRSHWTRACPQARRPSWLSSKGFDSRTSRISSMTSRSRRPT
ncbi:hypothetical protein [Variovorax sp. PvP013]|uniref:hypothetical protein n=1 Tax=Variovorax sp. PvP013 TaxID=3156435 RepID=UPI003D234D20